MKKIYASILITNYNKQKFLNKTLRSCVNQTCKNKEILLYDDCSTDNSINIIKKFTMKTIKNYCEIDLNTDVLLKKNKKNVFEGAKINKIIIKLKRYLFI